MPKPDRRGSAPQSPDVDAYVLNLARTRTFSTKDFVEMRDGSCRLSSTLTHELAATMPTWAQLVGPHAEMVTRHVAQLAKAGLGVVHSIAAVQRARTKVRVRPIVVSAAAPKAASSIPMSALHSACKECGAALTIRKRVYCDRCASLHREEQLRANAPTFTAAGPAKIAAMRAAGRDPTNSKEARLRRSSTAMKQRKAGVAWRDDGSLEEVDFVRDILPGLQRLPVKALAETMGCSISHGSKVRNGHLIPHRRHWKRLATIGRTYSTDRTPKATTP